MSETIINATRDVLKNGILNLSRKESARPCDVQLFIGAKTAEDGSLEPIYYLYKNWAMRYLELTSIL